MTCRTIWSVATASHALFRAPERRARAVVGHSIVEVDGPEKTENINLSSEIRLQNDAGRWEFFLQGTPFPFEETRSYKARRKTDRFTFDMMKRYLRELGLRPFDGDFYLPSSGDSATLVELSGNLPSSGRDVPLDEAQRLNGIDDQSGGDEPNRPDDLNWLFLGPSPSTEAPALCSSSWK